MSPLSRNELSIVLGPEQVALLRSEARLTWRGYRRRVRNRKVIPLEGGSDAQHPWRRALETLETELPLIAERGMRLNVILSNHFMQYLLVPWLDDATDEEEMALAQHCFREMCGSAADGMRVRISPGRAGMAALAGAVDSHLLEALDGLAARVSCELKSVQPHLMVAYNTCRASLAGRSAWLVLLEPDNVCLAVLRNGQLSWLRKMRISAEWDAELPGLLEREAYLADSEVALEEILLWAPHLDDIHAVHEWPWKVVRMRPGAQAA